MQPLSGLHIASLIDPQRFEVTLHHEDWHGPFEPQRAGGYAIAFLTGLQPDFDRMRQLSHFFRRAGATVVAGGSICTQFPEFAAEFFDVVCAGGVEIVADLMADLAAGRPLKPIYRSPITRVDDYLVDYGLLRRSGINLKVHLLEASRGCSFRCSFCVIPAEAGGHAIHYVPETPDDVDQQKALVTEALAAKPDAVVFNPADDVKMLEDLARIADAGIPVAHGRLILENYLRDHPEVLNEDGGYLFGFAMIDAFRCPSN